MYNLFDILEDTDQILQHYRILADSAFNGDCMGILKLHDVDSIYNELFQTQMAVQHHAVGRARVAVEWGIGYSLYTVCI